MLRSDASKTTNVKTLIEVDRRMARPPSVIRWAPSPFIRQSMPTLGCKPSVSCRMQCGLEPIRIDSMSPLGSKPIDIQLCRAFAARPQCTVRPPVRWPPRTCVRRTPLGPWVNGPCASRYANRQASAVPQRRATQASSQQPCTNREWCPASLVVPIALRREGRTETLT
jgi:hypothetical protein